MYAVSIDMDDVNLQEPQPQPQSQLQHQLLNQQSHHSVESSKPTHFHEIQSDRKNQSIAYPDLDLSKIELDSQLNYSSLNPVQMQQQQQTNQPNGDSNREPFDERKVWKVLVKHDARTFEELTVVPGMLFYVIKQFSDYLYGKIIGYENVSMSQQYGLIPKYCAQSLTDMLAAAVAHSAQRLDNVSTDNGLVQDSKKRKSQITAL